MGVFDDDGDYLSPLFEMDWKAIRNIIRKQTIERIYGDLGKPFGSDEENNT
jgi:hypothetical protein